VTGEELGLFESVTNSGLPRATDISGGVALRGGGGVKNGVNVQHVNFQTYHENFKRAQIFVLTLGKLIKKNPPDFVAN